MTALFPGHVDQIHVRKKGRKMAGTVSILCIGKAHTSSEYPPMDLSLPVTGKNFTDTHTWFPGGLGEWLVCYGMETQERRGWE